MTLSTEITSPYLAEEANQVTPGGVHSSTRTLRPPIVWKSSRGSRITDVEGREYIDYHAAFGPTILGYCDPRVDAAACAAVERIGLIGVGTNELEIELSRKLVQHIPSAEKALICVTGSEATFNAIRVSRAVTGRKRIVKFQGCYHGWHDYLSMNIITPAERLGRYDPASAGMLDDATRHTSVVEFNNLAAVEQCLNENRGDVAAIILEPIPHNVGCLLPRQEFLHGLRELATLHGAILIFDEVITGFRHGLGGYQSRCGVTPDLTTVAKAMANGYPCAALVGRADIMERFQTAGGDVFFAGTFNGHPSGVAAALQTIELLEDGSVHEQIFRNGAYVAVELQSMVERLGLCAHVAHYGSVFVVYFMEPPINSYTDLLRNDKAKDIAFRSGMVERGCFCLPLAMKRNHISAAHTDDDLARTLDAAESVLKQIARSCA